MSRYFTNADNANLIYFQFPKLLMYGAKYKKMSGDGKLFYMLCLDLIKLSMKNGWKDEEGRFYIKMSLETIKERMNCQNTKAINLKRELEKFGLMEEKRPGQGKSNRLYILQLEYTDDDIYNANNDHEEIKNDEVPNSNKRSTLEPQENSEKQNSRIYENGEQELQKAETIKKESFKNNQLRTSNNLYKENIDDRRNSPSGEVSAIHNDEHINLIISNFREATKHELRLSSFKCVVRDVMFQYNQGAIEDGNFRSYLSKSLNNKIAELEFRRMQDKAKQELRKPRKRQKIENLPQNQEVRDIPFYNWLEEEGDTPLNAI